MWLSLNNEIFKVPTNLDHFCQVNCLHELSSGYPKVWNSFQTSKNRFPKLQEAIWLTVINEIFKCPPRLGPFCQINCLFSGYAIYPIQKWYIWASFQTSRKKFNKLQEAIWPTVINEIFKCPPRLGPFCQINCLFSGYAIYPIQKWYIWASFQTSRKKFNKLQEAIWPTVINEIFQLPPRLVPFCQINCLFEFSLDYPSYPIQKYIWASFQTTRKKFCKFFKFSE